MSEQLCSVGLDVGTTTTQMIVSQLQVENRASGFAVPEMEITGRKILYQGDVQFTPLLDESHVDAKALRLLIEREYEKAGISPRQVDTGAVIITGETSRKENARAVLDALAGFAGEFVAATAGPDLESILAAKGAGAVDWSAKTGKTVLHMDIGGGTSNLALIKDGRIVKTGCLNVGGRLLKFDGSGQITYVSPVLRQLTPLQVGDKPAAVQLEEIAAILAQGLEMAAGLRQRTSLLDQLATEEAGEVFCCQEAAVISFSGGVADCIENRKEPFAYGDMGPVLGQAIKKSRLCGGEYMLGEHTIRATVIGAGSHSAQLSGSTVFFRNVKLPLKNLPVAVLGQNEQENPQVMAERMRQMDADTVVLAMPGYAAASYEKVCALADAIVQGSGGRAVYVCLEADMAKALGHSLCLRLPPETPCLCIDRIRLTEGSYLDVGAPVGPALPVVVKTLVLSQTR